MTDPKSRLDDASDRVNSLPVWAKLLVFPVILPLGLAYSMLAVGLLIALFPCLCVWGCWEHWRFLRKLRVAGRVARWADIEGPLKAGQGTLILVQGTKGLLDGWWVPGSLTAIRGHPLPTYRQCAALDFPENIDLLDEGRPSADECRAHYLHPDRGTAALVALPRGTLDRFRDEIPEAFVVIILAW